MPPRPPLPPEMSIRMLQSLARVHALPSLGQVQFFRQTASAVWLKSSCAGGGWKGSAQGQLAGGAPPSRQGCRAASLEGKLFQVCAKECQDGSQGAAAWLVGASWRQRCWRPSAWGGPPAARLHAWLCQPRTHLCALILHALGGVGLSSEAGVAPKVRADGGEAAGRARRIVCGSGIK